MTTSLLYHAFCIRTYTLLRTEYRDGSVYAHLQKKRYARRCAACHYPGVTLEGCAEVKVRTLPIGRRRVFLIRHLHRLRCRRCGQLKQEPRDLAAPRKSYSLALARLVLDLCQQMTLSAVAQYLQLNWHLCKDILMSDSRRKKERRRLRHVRRIAIDEIFVRSPHHFLTVVVDLDSGQVLYVGVGKDRSALAPFFAMLRAVRAKLQAIAVDMSVAFLSAILKDGPPGVLIVHDRFHITKMMNEVLDEVRRMQQNRLQSHRVYLLKEELRLLWEQPTQLHAHWLLHQWLRTARELGLRPPSRFCDTIEQAQDRILSWYLCPISTGPLEGVNNKIKVLNRRAYGHRDTEFLALRILFIHESQFKLTGT